MDTCLSNFKNSFSKNSLGFSYNLESLGTYYNLYKDNLWIIGTQNFLMKFIKFRI